MPTYKYTQNGCINHTQANHFVASIGKIYCEAATAVRCVYHGDHISKLSINLYHEMAIETMGHRLDTYALEQRGIPAKSPPADSFV